MKQGKTHKHTVSSAVCGALQSNALSSSSLKPSSLFERFRSCVNSGGGLIAGFSDSLKARCAMLSCQQIPTWSHSWSISDLVTDDSLRILKGLSVV